jgi:hypothetical protein
MRSGIRFLKVWGACPICREIVPRNRPLPAFRCAPQQQGGAKTT